MLNNIEKWNELLECYTEAEKILYNTWDKMDELIFHPTENMGVEKLMLDGFTDINDDVCEAWEICKQLIIEIQNHIERIGD